jgi:hypothetical protein
VVIDVVILPSMAMKNGDLTCGNCNENGWTWLVILCDFTWDTCYVMVGEMWDTSGNLTVCCGNNMDFFWKKTYKMVIFDSYGSLPERKCQNMAWNIMELMMGSLTQKKTCECSKCPSSIVLFYTSLWKIIWYDPLRTSTKTFLENEWFQVLGW